ncbi:hypothetical protein FGO68_gene14418 [Halteria grandinella]|uniref:Uncharacterized protein n=1 Tax=Halteria grandinella TaxID=5974 RepID=A0A8J8P4D8_HALGN|nr:hypothetical protein FGO68_gene14418 [Halteria grandinella]
MTHNDRLNVLRGPQFKNGIESENHGSESFDTMQIFFNYQELYSQRIWSEVVTTIIDTFTIFGDNYYSITLVLFLAFLFFDLFALFFLRARLMDQMREDIFESRGILNLIPNQAIENNKQEVESIIKKLKN